MIHFSNQVDLFHISIWSRAYRKKKPIGKVKPIPKNIKEGGGRTFCPSHLKQISFFFYHFLPSNSSGLPLGARVIIHTLDGVGLCPSINVKTPCSSDETTTTAASTLISLATTMAAVASSSWSFSVFNGNLHQSLPAFSVNKQDATWWHNTETTCEHFRLKPFKMDVWDCRL